MNHFNKQLEVNQSTLEQYLDEESRKEQIRNRLDKLGLGILILCGIIGVGYCMLNDHLFFKNANKEGIGQNYNGPNTKVALGLIAQKRDKHPTPTNEDAIDFVTVDGELRTGESLTFTLDEFDDAATYVFHLGNGETMTAKDNQLSYAYDLPGSYEVALKVSYQGETQQAWSKILTVSY